MASQVQYRRGTNAQNAAFTGALAEITVDTTNGTLRVHDAITVGGSNIATVAYVNSQISSLSSNSISFGTSSVAVIASGGNIRANVGGSTITNTYSSGLAVTGLISATGAVTAASVVGGVITGSSVSVTGAVTSASVVGGIMSGSSLSVTTGTITGGNIVNGNGNGIGNIGSSTTYFNTVFAKATSAQYADLAEKYTADADYSPGTVIEFGGPNEVTITTVSHSTQVAGIVSTNPSYLMNSGLVDAIEVALVGRVPCHVVGTIAKGDRLVASSTPGTATRLDMSQYQPGCIIGKALESYDSETVGTIEVAVGRI
jgi:hypothetical protein